MSESHCGCMTPPFNYRDFETDHLGTDHAAARCADVSIDSCRRCGQRFLHYHFEFEAFSRSGRWYRGAITPEQAERVTPATALAVLSSLSWYFYGGSYYDTTGRRSEIPLDPRVV